MNRCIRPAEPAEKADWDGRIAKLLQEEPGDVVITAVGDMIFNEQIKRIELIPFTIDDEGPLYGVPRLASTKRAKEIIELMQKLSAPYKTTIVDRGWYAEVTM